MKIAIDARFYGLEHTGLGRYTTSLIQAINKISPEHKFYVLLRKKYFNKLKLSSNWIQILADAAHYTVKEQLTVPKIISRINPDIFHALNPNVPILVRSNLVVTVHDTTQISWNPLSTTLSPLGYLIKHNGYLFVFGNAVKSAKRLITPTAYVRDDLISSFKIKASKICVIPEGVATFSAVRKSDYSRPQKVPQSEKYFLYVGNSYPHKNIERLIDAVKLFNQNKRHEDIYKLVLVCARDVFTEKLWHLVKNTGSEQFVKIVGHVSETMLYKLYKYSAAYVFPSLSEGFGLPGLEAMKTGTPVLASKIPVFREVYGGHAFYFDPYNTFDIADKMDAITRLTPKDRRKVVSDAKNFVKKYTWERCATETLKAYEDSAG